MKLSTTTIKTMADKGIEVRWYPEANFEDFKKRIWQNEFQSYCDYYKDHVAGRNEFCNVIFQTDDELKSSAKRNTDLRINAAVSPCNFNRLYISYDHDRLIVKDIKVQSKDITPEYIENLVAKDRKAYSGIYGAFAIAMQKICRREGLADLCSVCPTTYGIGVWVLFMWHPETIVERIEKIMAEHGIEYYNEYSDARWVYRFKVSKSKDNLARLTF